MASNSMVPKKHFPDKKSSNISSHEHDEIIEDDFQVEEEEEDNEISRGVVTSQIYLKSAGQMNKDVALRRIRHRKQVNKFKAATQSFLWFPTFKNSSKNDGNKVSNSKIIRWVDDAFAAP
ncbi:putative kinase [Capsicum annuum]|nr:putative kinase [Capsicum annuum]KAF3673601.1 putative kinase [Capsicum annuum]